MELLKTFLGGFFLLRNAAGPLAFGRLWQTKINILKKNSGRIVFFGKLNFTVCYKKKYSK
jgi:hypothetical protein